mgnify:CR=1 FL=1
MDPVADKKREARLRRLAGGMGLTLRKSRTRDAERMDFGCYRILEVNSGRVIAGSYPYAYSLSLDGVEEVLAGLQEDPSGLVAVSLEAPVSAPTHGCDGGAGPEWDDD